MSDLKKKNSAQTAGINTPSFKSWYYIIGLALICIIFYYKVLFGQAHFWEDLIHQEFPHRIFARDCLLHFQFPHWNPYTFSGMPFFAAIHTGVLYPFNLLMSLLPVSNTTFWYLLQLMIISHVFFSGLSMFILLRNKKLSDQAAFFGAIGYMLCGFFITHIIHSLMLYILAWLPLIVLFLERGLRENKLHFLILAGIILGFTIFAGHPQITFYQFLFLGSYCLYIWLSLSERKIFTLITIALPFILAAGIAMIQLLPTIEIGNQSARAGWTFEQACEGSFTFGHFFTFLLPKAFGSWSSPESKAPQFWLSGPNSGYYTYWDTCFYTGIAIFLFALFQLKNFRKNSFIKFSAVWCIASLVVALGSSFFVYKFLFHFVPGFGRFRSPARILFTWNFLLPFIAAYSFDFITKENLVKFKKHVLISLGICAVLAIAVSLGFFKVFWPLELEDAKISDYAATQGLVLLVNTLILGIPILFSLYNKLSIKILKALIICALLIDLFIFGFNHHISKTTNAAKFYSQNKNISEALIKESKSETFRANTRQFLLNEDSVIVRQSGLRILKRNQGMIDRVYMLEGYNPLNLYRRIPPLRGKQFTMFLDLLNVKYFINPNYRKGSKDLILLNEHRLPRAKMFYEYKTLANDSLVKEFMMNNSFDYKNTLLLTDKPNLSMPAKRYTIDNNVAIKHYSNNKIKLTVDTHENGLLWLSEIWYPAWKASVDGKKTKVYCADFSFRAIEVPKGSHEVTFLFSSSYFHLGALITIISLFSSFGFLIFLYLKKRKLY